MYDFAYAIQMVKVSPYHSPCNNNAVSHWVVLQHYYYMACDMAKMVTGNFVWNRVFSFSQLFCLFFEKKNKFSGSIIFRYLCIVVYFDRQLLSKWITKKTWKMLVMHCWCLCGKLNLFFLFQCWNMW